MELAETFEALTGMGRAIATLMQDMEYLRAILQGYPEGEEIGLSVCSSAI